MLAIVGSLGEEMKSDMYEMDEMWKVGVSQRYLWRQKEWMPKVPLEII